MHQSLLAHSFACATIFLCHSQLHVSLLSLCHPQDPNAPKKALSAFMYFSSDQRDKVKADNPGGCQQGGRALGFRVFGGGVRV